MADGETRFLEALRQVVGSASQVEVAQRAGVSQATISRILSGERGGSLRTAVRIIEAYPELGKFLLPADMPKAM